jgi:surfeit locus 1 family protein
MRRVAVPLAFALPVLGVLLYLGTWQAQRLAWKNAILAEIAAAEAGPARRLTPNPREFEKVALTGRFDHAREVLLGLEVRGPTLGAHLVTPLLRDDAAPVLVDRGWVPMESRAPIARPEGPVTIEGFIRAPDIRNRFSAEDDTAGRRFFTFDPTAIGAAIGLAPAPYAVVALGSPGGLPDPARTLPRPRNNHLGYAITWYGLALALLGVSAVWMRRRLKEPA